MDKEKELAHKLFMQGFSYGISYCLMNQKISGTIISVGYPNYEDLEKTANNCYLDVLLRELDEKEKQEKKLIKNKTKVKG